MEKTSEETQRAVKKCYLNLLKLLSINELAERLYSHEKLSYKQKSVLSSFASLEEKTRYFLDEILIPGINIGYSGHFDEMLIIMKESDNILTRLLAEKLMTNITTAAPIDTSVTDAELKIDFNVYEDVSNAFTELFTVCQRVVRVSNEEFKTIRNSCMARASEPLRSLIKHATDTHCLFEILAENTKYCNWMDVRFLKTIAIACGNKQLQSLIENYKTVIYSKTLHEVWDCIPHYAVRDKYYSELMATFDKDPDNMTVEELIKSKPQLAKKIALLIAVVQEDSVVVTWFIPTNEVYQAYLSFLTVPQESRKDNLTQFGTWTAYLPQNVLQNYAKEINCEAVSSDTLLIGYYHGLLLRDIDADLLTVKMCSSGLLTVNEKSVISSGHSVCHRNWLLLEYGRHKGRLFLLEFCELVQGKWPEISSQLNITTHHRTVALLNLLNLPQSRWPQSVSLILTGASTELQSKSESSFLGKPEVLSHCQCDKRGTITGPVVLTFYLHFTDQLGELLRSYDHIMMMERCTILMASDQHKIKLFSDYQLKLFSQYKNVILLRMLCSFGWSNCSILRSLVSHCHDAVKLLDKFESNLDPLQVIACYPIPCFSANMIPSDTSAYTILAVRHKVELYESSLQYVYDVQSVMIEKCDITQHCLQLLAVRSDPTIFYWTIPKCVVDLINTNVPLHSEYLYSRGILEVLVHPNLLLTTGDDVCYGSQVFECKDQLEVLPVTTAKRKDVHKPDLLAQKPDWLSFCYHCVASIVCNLFVVFIIAGIIIATTYDGNKYNEVNLTMEPERIGTEVVKAVVNQIKASGIFESNYRYDYIRRIARVESKDGLDNATYRENYHGGIWQVDKSLFLVTQNTSIPILINKHELVKMQFDTDWVTLQWEDLRIPLWSGLAVCLYMCTIDEEIPSSIDKQAEHWNRNYNSKKEHQQTPEEFVAEVKELEARAAALNTRYEVDLDTGVSKVFKYAVPKEGITIQLKVTKGKVTLYGSYSNPDPNPVWHDYMLSGICGDQEIVISNPTTVAKQKQDDSTVPFYCNLIGVENSTLSIIAVNGTS